MEGVAMKVLGALFILSLMGLGHSETPSIEKVNIGVRYLNSHYAHIHQNPNRFSVALTTISCAHPMRLIGIVATKGNPAIDLFAKEWRLVKAGPYEGYIRDSFLSEKKPECFQDKYSKFFEGLKLEIADMYYWGRLYDLYDYGHTKVSVP